MTTGSLNRTLLEDAYTVTGYMISVLGDVEEILTWLPDGMSNDFNNSQNFNCIFVPSDKEKHGTWMHSYLPSLQIKSDLLGTDYLANYVGTRALAFAYGATGQMFENSPVSSEPGVFWIHWKDHEWKSITDEKFSYDMPLLLETIDFIEKVKSGKKVVINPSKMKKQLLGMNAIITSAKRNGAPVKLEEAPSYVSDFDKPGYLE